MAFYEKDFVPFVPNNCANDICDLLNGHSVFVHIKRHRISKLGDFSVNKQTNSAKITINGSLDNYSFLITLLHEIAHLYVWERYPNHVKPHGYEWQKTFKELMQPFLDKNVFPTEIDKALRQYMISPGASTTGNARLVHALMPYSITNTNKLVSHVPNDVTFVLPNGMRMKKIKLLRTRYECICLDNNKIYSVSPNVAVTLVNDCFK